MVAGWLEAGQVAGGRWLEAGDWWQMAGRGLEGGWRQVAGGRWPEAGGWGIDRTAPLQPCLSPKPLNPETPTPLNPKTPEL